MLRWESKELEYRSLGDLNNFFSHYDMFEGVRVKDYIVYNTMTKLIYLNTKTVNWDYFNKYELSIFNKNDLTEDTIFHFEICPMSLEVYAFNPETYTCSSVQRVGYTASENCSSVWEFGSSSYFVDADFCTSGRISRFDQKTLKWHALQTHGYERISSINNHWVDGQSVYFGIRSYDQERELGLAKLNMETLQWQIVYGLECNQRLQRLYENDVDICTTILFMRDHVIYFTLGDRKFYSFNCLTKTGSTVCISGNPRYWDNLKCSFSMGDRIIFPHLNHESSGCFGRNVEFKFAVLNTNVGLKDLAMESVLKKKIKAENIPGTLQKEMNILNKLLETNRFNIPPDEEPFGSDDDYMQML